MHNAKLFEQGMLCHSKLLASCNVSALQAFHLEGKGDRLRWMRWYRNRLRCLKVVFTTYTSSVSPRSTASPQGEATTVIVTVTARAISPTTLIKFRYTVFMALRIVRAMNTVLHNAVVLK